MEKEKPAILVSACLLGVECRYDGTGGSGEEVRKMLDLMKDYRLVPVCPEQLGGLTTPRKPSEIQSKAKQLTVMNSAGEDVTEQYCKGARECLKLAKLYGCQFAVMKERSPACGCDMVYDGTFTKKRIPGKGVAAGFLEENGIKVFGESQTEALFREYGGGIR